MCFVADSSLHLWLFGGSAYIGGMRFLAFAVDHVLLGFSGYCNDFWMFDTTAKTWAWSAGSNVSLLFLYRHFTLHRPLVTLATGAPFVSRAQATATIRLHGRTWALPTTATTSGLSEVCMAALRLCMTCVTAGFGYIAGATLGFFQDVWMFNVATKQWYNPSRLLCRFVSQDMDERICSDQPSRQLWPNRRNGTLVFGSLATDILPRIAEPNLPTSWPISNPAGFRYVQIGASHRPWPNQRRFAVFMLASDCL